MEGGPRRMFLSPMGRLVVEESTEKCFRRIPSFPVSYLLKWAVFGWYVFGGPDTSENSEKCGSLLECAGKFVTIVSKLVDFTYLRDVGGLSSSYIQYHQDIPVGNKKVWQDEFMQLECILRFAVLIFTGGIDDTSCNFFKCHHSENPSNVLAPCHSAPSKLVIYGSCWGQFFERNRPARWGKGHADSRFHDDSCGCHCRHFVHITSIIYFGCPAPSQ